MPNLHDLEIRQGWRDWIADQDDQVVPVEPHPPAPQLAEDPWQAGQDWLERVVRDNQRIQEHPMAFKLKDMGGKRGEELFQLILSGIREIYDTDAVIAGGAVRDLAAGVTNHKDVDVFIPLSWKKFHEGQFELGWQGGGAEKFAGGYEKCVIPSTARARSRVQNVPVDLVFVKKPLSPDDVAAFPVHAQRCVWTLEHGLKQSPEAKADIEGKLFTIDPYITEKDRLQAVLKKVKEWCKRDAYRDWKIVEPDVKEWWEAKEEAEKKEKEKINHTNEVFKTYWDNVKMAEPGQMVQVKAGQNWVNVQFDGNGDVIKIGD